MTPYEERLKVIANIDAAVRDGDLFRKAELFDPIITQDDIKRVIEPFDTQRQKLTSKIKAHIARRIAESETKKRNTETVIVGLENALSVEGGALITQNHFSIMDNTIARLLAIKCGRHKAFDIVIQETNVFMTGFFGFLMKNCYTLPVSRSASYMAKNLKPTLKRNLERGHFILIYPEQELWFNYKKPRDAREGAYHYAAEFMKPIIPTFVTMENTGELEENGFYKQRHTLHVMPPIYPDPTLTIRENRDRMRARDLELKRRCYEETYKIPLTDDFLPERDIAGYP